MERGAGQLPPVVAPPGAQRFITQRDENKWDLFSGHAITETRFSDSLWFTAGYSYTTLGSDLAGTRIIGSHFDATFGEPVLTLRPFDEGFLNLAGTAETAEHVFNANLLWEPLKSLTVLTAFRYTQEDIASDSTFLFTDTEANVPPFTPSNPNGGFHQTTPVPTFGSSSDHYDRFSERLELRYTGIVNWLFYGQGEWEEEFGDVHQREDGGIAETPLRKETTLLDQKYSVGANWYPTAGLNLSAQYYHRIEDLEGEIETADHQRLAEQDWNTDDVNVRITSRPKIPACLGTLALVARYDFVRTAIDTQWQVFGNGEILDELETGVITKHVITESITWYPLVRLYLQTNVSYVLDQTETPASKINLIPNTSPTVVDFRNDYWTVSATAGFLLDDNTDLNADYSFFCANDHFKNARVAQPYGLGATEHTVSAGIGHQLNKHMRLTLKYTYFNYDDSTFGGHNDYSAHSIFSGLQYRF
jgi:predicted porin